MRSLALGLWLAAFGVQAAEPVQTYTRFCASCGVWGADTVASASGQFVIHGNANPKPLFRSANTKAVRLINVEPQMLAVTAERAKRAFLQELRAADGYQDKIHAVILDLAAPDRPIQLISEIYLDGFAYRLAVPGRVEHTRLVRALVRVLLQEYANRGSHRNSELPRWLIEGMTKQVLSSTIPTYVANEEAAVVEVLGYDRLSYTRAYLSTNSPMTVQELSFFDGDPGGEKRFEACAHLFVYELLNLKGGPSLMARFLRRLPSTLNWQTAFYETYGRLFDGPLALEKWWMLAWLDQKSRPAQEIWSEETSLRRLGALLLTTAETRLDTNSIPRRRDVTLQRVLSSSDFGVQKEIISQTVQELFFLSMNLANEVLPLAQSYQQALEDYVQKRSVNETQPGLRYDPEQRAQTLFRGLIDRLDELDRAREDLRQGRVPTARLAARVPARK